LTRGSIKLHQILDQILGKVDGFPGQPGNDAQLLSHFGYYTSVTPVLARTIKLTGTCKRQGYRWPGGVHCLDGQLMVVLDVDRVLELAPKTSLAA